jgi:hypothetical protein
MNELCLLVLIAPPQIEEDLVDFLLGQEGFSGFSLHRIDGSPAHGALSLAEQVTGRRRQVMFQVHAPRTDAQALVQQLGETFRGAGLHYWISPLIEAGPIL